MTTTKALIGRLVTVAGVGVAGVRAVRRTMSGPHRGDDDATRDRWLAVTVLRSPDEVVHDGTLPAPLAELGDLVEVQVRPAPGDKGTEVAARLTGRRPTPASARVQGRDPRQRVRAALREAKSLLEVGEIVRPDAPPTPRALLQDRASQLAYGLFASTFTFAILALREVDAVNGGTVPGLTVLVAYLLMLASIAALFLYIHHAANSLRAAGLIDLVGDRLHEQIDRLYPADDPDPT